jgi:hypothetical protein
MHTIRCFRVPEAEDHWSISKAPDMCSEMTGSNPSQDTSCHD